MFLSKSDYCCLWQCPRQLWLERNRPQLATPDSAQEERMRTGSAVGDLAKGLFGEFTEVTVLAPDGSPDLPAMAEKTQACLKAGTEVICEAAFLQEGLYCAVDILRKQGGGYAIYEVKSATQAADIYAADMAYQRYVLERCGVQVTGTYLVHINPDYTRSDELDIRQLFSVTDLAGPVSQEMPHIPARLALAEGTLASGEEPATDLDEHCFSPYDCPYWAHCSRHLPKPSVFDLYRLSGKKKFAYYRKGVISYPQLLESAKLSEKQLRQVRFQLTDCGDHIDKAGIRAFLGTLHYPLCFLDFETMQQVVPEYPGTKPYQQIPFQYSLHIVEKPGAAPEHRAFLAQSGPDPRRAVAESLCRDIPRGACVAAYNKGFECARLEELARCFPDLSARLLDIAGNIRDLMVPFREGLYYNRAMGGSFSIKSVLPALFPQDPGLDYRNLEGVHNGSEAMALFPRLKDMAPEERDRARRALLAYCRLDTYALVRIWQALTEAAEEG